MDHLGERLRHTLRGRICVMGVGNVDYGDDGFGVYLAEELAAGGVSDVLIAGTSPDRHLGTIAEQRFDHLLLIDAVDFSREPGSAVFLNATEIENAYPQISTHKISLGVLAKVMEEAGTHVWLLGVQPESLHPGQYLTDSLQATLEAIGTLLKQVWFSQVPRQRPPQPMPKVVAS
ncbi:MAG TPA: hydrogenase maturation protease [Terriglobales bacterium]|nr:hydrogenase maturation protease [Terriglobales bacterium]